MTSHVGRYFDDGSAQFAGWTPLLWDPLGAALVDLAAPAAGERVLDACCGAGSSALPAARAVGPTGRVDGVDLADGLLSTARARAGEIGLTNIEFTCADVTRWRGGPYQLLQCGFGVFFLPDMDADTDRLLGLLADGGRFAMTCWPAGSLENVFRPFFAALAEHRPEIAEAAPPQFALNSERLQTEDALRCWLTARGLSELEIRRREHDVPIDADLAWDFLHSGPMRGLLSEVDDDTRARVEHAFRRLLADAGTDTLHAPFLVASGRKVAW